VKHERYVAFVRLLAMAAGAVGLSACEIPPAGCECNFAIDGGTGPGASVRFPGAGCTPEEFDAGGCHNLYQTTGPLSPPEMRAT
jgi:hypothetical protein